tara:strand:+ start:273 stop:380 length:108 start_codon:yes stop_codon:yes gene_type:complete
MKMILVLVEIIVEVLVILRQQIPLKVIREVQYILL